METGTFQTYDGLNLYYRFLSGSDSSPIMVIVHGHGEHSGRYVKFKSKLSSLDLSYAMFDTRGHGQSEGVEAYVNNFDDYVRDLKSFMAFLEQKFGDRRELLLFGHSNGAMTSVHWSFTPTRKIRALILSSPCFGIRLAKPLIALNSFLNLFVPKLEFKNPVYPPHLSHNLEEVEQYTHDPLVKRKITVRLIDEMLRYSKLLAEKEKIKYTHPLYILMADDLERVVDPESTKKYFEKVVAPVKEIQTFPEFYHEIFNELEQDKAFEALEQKLKRVLSP